jgi:hypothetical protein
MHSVDALGSTYPSTWPCDMTGVGEVNDRRKDTRRRGGWMACGGVAGWTLGTGSTTVIQTSTSRRLPCAGSVLRKASKCQWSRTRLGATRERLAVQASYWVIHMTGVALGIVSVFELLIQIGQPHRVSETTLRASSPRHVRQEFRNLHLNPLWGQR